MSRAKKAAYAEAQRLAAVQAEARKLTVSTESAPMPKAATKVKTRKQSRGK